MAPEFDWKSFDRGVFVVNVLSIVYSPDKHVIIGRRKSDPYLSDLSWTFPGGRPSYDEDLESALRREIKRKTNLDVEIDRLVYARTYPEDRRLLSIYYLTKPLNMGEERPGEKFVEIRWVRPEEVENYFRYPAMDPKVVGFLRELK